VGSSWRDQPGGLACAVVAGFFLLTAIAFALAIGAFAAALR